MGVQKALGINKSLRKKGEKRPFGAIEVETVESQAWQKLNRTEAHVYNTLKTFYQGKSEPFPAPFEALKKRSRIKHGHTLDKAIQGLEDKQWIAVVRYAKHGKRRGLRVKANEYRLTAMHDVLRW